MPEVMIRLTIEWQPEGVYLVTSDDVPGLILEVDSIAEAIELAQSTARILYEVALEHGDPIPPALTAFVVQDQPIELLVPIQIPHDEIVETMKRRVARQAKRA